MKTPETVIKHLLSGKFYIACEAKPMKPAVDFIRNFWSCGLHLCIKKEETNMRIQSYYQLYLMIYLGKIHEEPA